MDMYLDKDRISGAAKDAAGTVEQLYGQAKDTMHDIGDAASGYAKDAVDVGADIYRDGRRAAAAAIRNQPFGALLAAGAAGFLLALMIGRQPQRRSPRRYR